MQIGKFRLNFVVRNDPLFFQVDEQHLAGLQAPLFDDLFFRNRQHAHFRGHDDVAVVGHIVAGGAQAVAV